ncbi:hypothetical protein BDV10DRAFT_55185 [Aspergillus recurvatus]
MTILSSAAEQTSIECHGHLLSKCSEDIAEEMRDAERSAPKAMLWSMIFSAVTSLMGAPVMSFCLGDWKAYLETDLPIVPWLVDILGGSIAGGSAMILVVIVFLKQVEALPVDLALGVLLFPHCRWCQRCRMSPGLGDGKRPGSSLVKVYYHISPRLETSLNSISLVVGAEFMFGFVVFGRACAFQAIVSLGNASIQLGYLIPTLMVYIAGP